MVTEQNQLQTPDDLPADAPTYEDGGNANQSYEPPAPAPAAEEGEEQAEPQQWKDEKRAEIFARAREAKAAKTTPFSGDANDPDALYGADVDTSDMGELELEALRRRQDHLAEITGQPPRQQQPQPQRKPLNGVDPQILATTVPIIVDGEYREVTVEEALREMQINRAADKRFAQANALLRQSQEFQRTRPQPGQGEESETSEQDQSTNDGQDDFDRELGHTSRRPANVKDLVEKIQLGSPDEAAEALEDFISSARSRTPPVDETTRVQTALEDINAKQAVTAFAQANPHIANNPALQMEATKVIHRNMAEDLIRAGYTMDELRELAPGPQQLTQLHKQARIAGLKGVRRVSDLIAAGYQGAFENFRALVEQASPGQAQHRAPNLAQRQQRKEALQPQPAARRLAPSLNATAQTRTQDQSRQAAVNRIKQGRGQPT